MLKEVVGVEHSSHCTSVGVLGYLLLQWVLVLGAVFMHSLLLGVFYVHGACLRALSLFVATGRKFPLALFCQMLFV